MSQEMLIAPTESSADEPNRRRFSLDNGLTIDVLDTGEKRRAWLYRGSIFIKAVDLKDAPAKRLFVTEAVELGATKIRLAEALGLSRQTIDNYLDIKHHFGVEGLIHNYSPSKSKHEQRREQAEKAEQAEDGTDVVGNKARLLEEMRRQEREAKAEQERQQKAFDFSFEGEGKAEEVPAAEQPCPKFRAVVSGSLFHAGWICQTLQKLLQIFIFRPPFS